MRPFYIFFVCVRVHVNEFQYLGSGIAESGGIDAEVDRRIENASKAFGAMKEAVFRDCALTINTKKMLYRACVLSVLLYGGECWIYTTEKTPEEAGVVSPQVYTHCAGDQQ